MTPVSLSTLEGAIIKPGLEKHLRPLVMYRGSMTLGRAHRMWNLVVSAMEQDCALSDITQRLQLNPEYSHLCGPNKVAQNIDLCGFLSRLEMNPDVTNNVPHLLDYVRSVGGRRWALKPIAYQSNDPRCARNKPWREFIGYRPRAGKPKLRIERPQLVYPFLIHDAGKPEHDLLKKVNAAIPKYYSPDLRADMCQDLIVGILCGDFTEDDLQLPAKEMTRKVLKMFPTKYGPVSLDADLTGDGFTLMDTLSDDMNPWEMMETM